MRARRVKTVSSHLNTVSVLFEIFKTFYVFTIKHRRFRLRKCYLGVVAVKYKQSGLHKKLTRFSTANSVKYEFVIIGTIKRSTSDLEIRKGDTKVRKQGAGSLYLFEIKIKQQFRDFN